MGFFDNTYGGGSVFDATLNRDVTFKLNTPIKDKYNTLELRDGTYMRDTVYGLMESFFEEATV